MSDSTVHKAPWPTPAATRAAWQRAVRIEPALAELATIADASEVRGLASLDRWALPFNELAKRNPRLAPFREAAFAELLRRHLAALKSNNVEVAND